MGAWNVLSLREDDHLSLLSSKLKHLDIGIAALYEVRRPDCGEIMGGYTYYWSGRSDPPAVELDVRGVTIPIADPPINCGPPSFVETQAAVNWLKWGKDPGICGIYAQLLKAGGNAALVS